MISYFNVHIYRALSRSGKKVLHVDKNPYYGGAESAFSLQEAELWMKQVNQGKPLFSTLFALLIFMTLT